jgi:hypothetical protein
MSLPATVVTAITRTIFEPMPYDLTFTTFVMFRRRRTFALDVLGADRDR